jgi:hypothetical protein
MTGRTGEGGKREIFFKKPGQLPGHGEDDAANPGLLWTLATLARFSTQPESLDEWTA